MVLINVPRYARGSVNRPNVINDTDLPIVDPQIRTATYREIRCRYENYNPPRVRAALWYSELNSANGTVRKTSITDVYHNAANHGRSPLSPVIYRPPLRGSREGKREINFQSTCHVMTVISLPLTSAVSRSFG